MYIDNEIKKIAGNSFSLLIYSSLQNKLYTFLRVVLRQKSTKLKIKTMDRILNIWIIINY